MSGGTSNNKSLYKDKMDQTTSSLPYSYPTTDPTSTLGGGRISRTEPNLMVPPESTNYSTVNDMSMVNNAACYSNFNSPYFDLFNPNQQQQQPQQQQQQLNSQYANINDGSYYTNGDYLGYPVNPQPINYLENTINESFSFENAKEGDLNNPTYGNRPHSGIYTQPGGNQTDFYPQYVPSPTAAAAAQAQSQPQKLASTPNNKYPKPVDTKGDGSTNRYTPQQPTPLELERPLSRGNSSELKRSNAIDIFSSPNQVNGYNANLKSGATYNEFSQFPLAQPSQSKQLNPYNEFSQFPLAQPSQSKQLTLYNEFSQFPLAQPSQSKQLNPYNEFSQFPLAQPPQSKQSAPYTLFNPFYTASNVSTGVNEAAADVQMNPYIAQNQDIYSKSQQQFPSLQDRERDNIGSYAYPYQDTSLCNYGNCGDCLGFPPQYYSDTRPPYLVTPSEINSNTTTIKPFPDNSNNPLSNESPTITYSAIRRQLLPKGVMGRKDNSHKKKRMRMSYSRKQLSFLEGEYQKNQFLQRERRLEIAKLLNLSDRQIKIWFQNRRMKQKRNDISVSSKDGSPKTGSNSNCSPPFENEGQGSIAQNLLQKDTVPPSFTNVGIKALPDNAGVGFSHKDDTSITENTIDVTCSSSNSGCNSVNSISNSIDPVSGDKKSIC